MIHGALTSPSGLVENVYLFELLDSLPGWRFTAAGCEEICGKQRNLFKGASQGIPWWSSS